MKKAFIYIIKNHVNCKVYIGQTKVNIETRWKEHVRHSKYGAQIINRAMKKYGVDNFYIQLLEQCDIYNVDQKEIEYIKLYNSTDKKYGYNISLGGETPKFKRPQYNIKKAIQYYKDGKSLDFISKSLNISRYILRQDLIKMGFEIRNRYFYNIKFKNITKKQIFEALELKLSLRKAAKKYNVPYSTFRNACIYYNIEYNSSTSAQHP